MYFLLENQFAIPITLVLDPTGGQWMKFISQKQMHSFHSYSKVSTVRRMMIDLALLSFAWFTFTPLTNIRFEVNRAGRLVCTWNALMGEKKTTKIFQIGIYRFLCNFENEHACKWQLHNFPWFKIYSFGIGTQCSLAHTLYAFEHEHECVCECILIKIEFAICTRILVVFFSSIWIKSAVRYMKTSGCWLLKNPFVSFPFIFIYLSLTFWTWFSIFPIGRSF